MHVADNLFRTGKRSRSRETGGETGDRLFECLAFFGMTLWQQSEFGIGSKLMGIKKIGTWSQDCFTGGSQAVSTVNRR